MAYLQFPEADLITAIFGRLNAQLPPIYAALSPAVQLVVTDTPQRDAAPPFVQIGDTIATYLGTFGTVQSVWNCETTIHCWTGPDRRLGEVSKGRLPNDTIRAQVAKALTDSTLGAIALGHGWGVCTMCHALSSRCFLDANATDYHGLLIFKSVVISGPIA